MRSIFDSMFGHGNGCRAVCSRFDSRTKQLLCDSQIVDPKLRRLVHSPKLTNKLHIFYIDNEESRDKKALTKRVLNVKKSLHRQLNSFFYGQQRFLFPDTISLATRKLLNCQLINLEIEWQGYILNNY